VVDRLGDLDEDDVFNEIYNIGYGEQVQLLDFVKEIEIQFGRQTNRNLVPAHPANTPETWADTTRLQLLSYSPTTPVYEGVKNL